MIRYSLLASFILLLGVYLNLEETSARRVITADGRKYNEDDCEESADRHARSCAVIFEQEECDTPDWGIGTGDELAIQEGVWKNLRFTGFHEDVKSVIVKPGCVLFGYDENSQNDRGTGISVSAVGKRDWVYKELNSKRFDLRDDIEAVECYCGAKATQATEIKPLRDTNFLSEIASWAHAGTAVNHCNMWIHAFNRLPKNKRPCAILFEAEDCETSDGLWNNWHKEIVQSNRFVNLPELSTGAKADSAEAVLVGPGCTFIGADENNGRGKTVTVAAPRGQQPRFYPLGSKYNPFKTGLKEDIDSYKCTC